MCAGALAGALAGCGGDKTAQGAGGPPGAGGGRGGPPPAMPVEVVVARRDTVVDAIDATGQIEAVQAIELRPEVEGRLVAILVTEGSVVRRGTPLFKVDDAELRTQIARLEADRDLAQQALTRTKGLLDQRASTTSELERAEATARSTQAQLDLLTLRRDRTTVRAPFAGVVGRRLASLGDYVSSQTRLITLQTFDPQRAVFQVPERFAERLSVGQRMGFRVAALPGRTITAKARVSNPRRELQSGMFIEARLVTATRPSAVVVPEDAILSLQGAMVVWVAKDGKASRRPVELGVRTPGFVEVTAGIEAGEQVVVGGAERLGEGAPVQPTVVERGKALVREGPARS